LQILVYSILFSLKKIMLFSRLYFLKNCIDGFADPCLFNFIFSQENYAVFKTLFIHPSA
jgi:hypothetical protein